MTDTDADADTDTATDMGVVIFEGHGHFSLSYFQRRLVLCSVLKETDSEKRTTLERVLNVFSTCSQGLCVSTILREKMSVGEWAQGKLQHKEGQKIFFFVHRQTKRQANSLCGHRQTDSVWTQTDRKASRQTPRHRHTKTERERERERERHTGTHRIHLESHKETHRDRQRETQTQTGYI